MCFWQARTPTLKAYCTSNQSALQWSVASNIQHGLYLSGENLGCQPLCGCSHNGQLAAWHQRCCSLPLRLCWCHGILRTIHRHLYHNDSIISKVLRIKLTIMYVSRNLSSYTHSGSILHNSVTVTLWVKGWCMYQVCTKFRVDSWSRFPFTVQTHT